MEVIEKSDLWEKLKRCKKPVVLYGTGNGADKVLAALNGYGINVSGVFCSDEFFRDKFFHGFKVMRYEAAKEIFGDMVVLMCFGSRRDDVLKNVKRIESEQEFYVPDVPVFGGGLFSREYFAKYKSRLESVYDRLADEQSRFVFESVLNYKLSGKTKYLYDCETDEKEAHENILCFGEDEEYLDLGAYDGDTVLEFTGQVCGRYKSIIAVEPDVRSFKKLESAVGGFERIEILNAAVSDSDGFLPFDAKGGRSSAIDGEGKVNVAGITVDGLEKSFTYIKMDVEGNEIKAVEGAKKTIARHKPKLLISAYHRNEDIFAIPEAVLAINPDYKLYMRHYKYLPAWDTNYYFV